MKNGTKVVMEVNAENISTIKLYKLQLKILTNKLDQINLNITKI